MKIGVLGYRGRLGSVLVERGGIGIECDITDPQSVDQADLDQYDVVVNCAAKTGVDACQTPPNVQTEYYKQAVLVNCRSLDHLRSMYRGRLIHISTDYVFDCHNGPYCEDNERVPVNDYGYTKLGGEIVLETANSKAETVVVRTTGLFGAGNDFASFALKKWSEGEDVRVSRELHGNHTYIPHLCEALERLAVMDLPQRFQYLHLASIDVTNREWFAQRLAIIFGYSIEQIVGVFNSQIPSWKAPRPTNGGLNTMKAEEFKLPLYFTWEGIQAYRERLSNGEEQKSTI